MIYKIKKFNRKYNEAVEALNNLSRGGKRIPRPLFNMSDRDFRRLHIEINDLEDSGEANIKAIKNILKKNNMSELSDNFESFIERNNTVRYGLRRRLNYKDKNKKIEDINNNLDKIKLHSKKSILPMLTENESSKKALENEAKKYNITTNFNDKLPLNDGGHISNVKMNREFILDRSKPIIESATISGNKKLPIGLKFHEIGHLKHLNEMKTGPMAATSGGRSISELLNEIGANREGLKSMKERGLAKRQLAEARNRMENGTLTYMDGIKSHHIDPNMDYFKYK